MRTYQDIFITVYNHLIKQGGQAVGANGGCLYRAEDGRKCAIGCLITDGAYSRKIERTSMYGLQKGHNKMKFYRVVALRVAMEKSRISLSERSLVFLEKLQGAHDSSLRVGIPQFKKAMRKIATDYKLEMP